MPLAEAVRRLKPLKTLSSVYMEYLEAEDKDPEVAREIEALVERSYRSGLSDGNGEPTGWNREIVMARVADPEARKRHGGGSPNAEEIQAYASLLPESTSLGEASALVLGMTPELREMAARRFARVFTVDKSRPAVQVYRNWLPAELRAKEQLFSVDWLEVGFIDWRGLPPVRAILGDGIFGNLPDEAAHRALLRNLRTEFPEAVFVFRKALALPQDPSDEAVLLRLRGEFRAGRIDADGFGFCVRMQGFLNEHFDSECYLLDNEEIFRNCERRFQDGFFDQSEIEAIRRFRFNGKNCLLTRDAWEELLVSEGFQFSVTQLEGQPWYPFYPIYRIPSFSEQ